MLKLYTDESPGLKVDPFVVMVLSIGFIISVVALHSEFPSIRFEPHEACQKKRHERGQTEKTRSLTRVSQFSPRSPRGSLREQGNRSNQRAWRLWTCREFLYTTFFSLAEGLSGLYHIVTRSLAKIVPSKIGFRSFTCWCQASTRAFLHDCDCEHGRRGYAIGTNDPRCHVGEAEAAKERKWSCEQCYGLQ
jgi:hypothetical protein